MKEFDDNDIEKALDEIENMILLKSKEVLDQTILYHYTDASGLNSILSSNQLYLSNRIFLNDAIEMTYSNSIIETEIQTFLGKNPKLDQRLISIKDHFIRNSDEYIFSLTTEEDSIHQWSYYGHKDGYALGFKFSDINKFFKDSITSYKSGIVIYDEITQRECIKKLLLLLENEITSDITTLNFTNMFRPEITLFAFFSLFKQSNHDCEKEYRFVIKEPDINTCYRPRNGVLLPYQIVGDGKKSIPVCSITIGPSVELSIAEIGLRGYLKKIGREDIIVIPTSLKIRQT